MRRQLHLMYDMICDNSYINDLMGNNTNLLLKQNLFSMKQMHEIKNGAMIKFLEKCYSMISKHMLSCSVRKFRIVVKL